VGLVVGFVIWIDLVADSVVLFDLFFLLVSSLFSSFVCLYWIAVIGVSYALVVLPLEIMH
jgi:hypothetical protein